MPMNAAKLLLLNVLGGGAAFSPLDISGLALWLDASDSATLFQDSAGTTPATADNDVVGYWGDKSGNARHATQATTANKFTLKTAYKNGLNVLGLDGGDILSTPALSFDLFTVFIVFRATGTPGLLYEQSTNANTKNGSYLYTHTSATTHVRRANNYSGDYINNWGMDGAWRVAAHTYMRTAMTLHVNGVSVLGALSGTPSAVVATDNLYVGARNGPIAGTTGHFAEFILYAQALDAAQRLSVEAYLNAKWGVY